MKNMVVYIRHSESESNVVLHNNPKSNLSSSEEALINSFSDPNITNKGKAQALVTANFLFDKIKSMKKTNLKILVSPFKRAQQTMLPFIELCEKHNIKHNFIIMNELQEYTSPKKILNPEQKMRGLVNHHTWQDYIPFVLKFNDILKQELKKQKDNEILIIFGHSLFFSSLLSYHIAQEEHMSNDKPHIHQPNCCISCESYDIEREKWLTYIVSSVAHISSEIISGDHMPFGTLSKQK